MPSERRKSTRYHCNGGVELRRNENAAPVFANLSDISLEGAYIEASSTVASGSEVLFVMRVRDTQIRGRARVKASNHAVGMGLEFVHLSAEDQTKLEFLVGTLSGDQDLKVQPERFVAQPDPLVNDATQPVSARLHATRPSHVASMHPPRVGGGANTPRASGPAPSALPQGIMRAIGELNELEQRLVKDRVDPRLIAQLHDSVEHVRQTAWTVQQWVDLHTSGGDPFEVLPQLEAERMQMLRKLAHNVTADIDAASINQYTLGVSELYETVEQLYRRLRKMLVEDAPGEV